MKYSTLIIVIFCSATCYAQLPDSVFLTYFNGHDHFGRSGKYAVSEELMLTRTTSGSYIFTKHSEIAKSFDSVNNTILSDTVTHKSGRAVPEYIISQLFTEMNTSRENFHREYVEPFLRPPSKNEVNAVIHDHGLHWKIEDKDRREKNKVYKELHDFSLLDTFLRYHKADPEFVTLVSDSWHFYSVSFYEGTKTTRYTAKFSELLAQPVSLHSNAYPYSAVSKTMNLEINNCLRRVLPDRSILKYAIDLNRMKAAYIAWYIQKSD